jgi:predicted RNase H-related nuclease YkuK (DUF458 family)
MPGLIEYIKNCLLEQIVIKKHRHIRTASVGWDSSQQNTDSFVMRTYRRSKEGQVFFFTIVTNQRRNILTTELGRDCLRKAFREVRASHPFTITGFSYFPITFTQLGNYHVETTITPCAFGV